jgi:hypothetical protein
MGEFRWDGGRGRYAEVQRLRRGRRGRTFNAKVAKSTKRFLARSSLFAASIKFELKQIDQIKD